MKKMIKNLSSVILIIVFLGLIVITSYMISQRYGIVSASENQPVNVVVSLECNNVDNLEFALTTEENLGKSIVSATINLKDGNTYMSHDCEKVVLYFGGNAPDEIFLTDLLGEQVTLNDVIDKNEEGRYSLELDFNETPILSSIHLRYNDAIERSGLASYAARGRFKILEYRITPQIERMHSKIFFSLPYSFSPNGHFPQSVSQTVAGNFDHIKYYFPDDTETFVVRWSDQDEQDRSVLEMLFLSALFGVGLSGLIEMVLGRLRK